MYLNLLVSSGFKSLRKPLTTSGWTRPELPSGMGRDGDGSWELSGTDLTLLFLLPMTYTTRPSLDLSEE
uniref:Uncharacterized protein n=1 Tax=Heterorhabditis bacteriophora TaxID=37862 RepID=A0A1I7X328_HETBA